MPQKRDPRLLEVRNGITFVQCLEHCLHDRDFRTQWERLSGKTLLARNPFDRLIDKATGYDLAVMQAFADDVYRTVFSLL